ncbi:MAG: hypothetical protein K0R54_224 [Clostridiaceae bacterium]|jgi:predicted HAD superfamily hydrolase|nr:hypothetical protein [Clostridiaceae bacterium]
MNRNIKLSKHLTNSGCSNNKVLLIGQYGSGIKTMFLNHNIKNLNKIAVYQSCADFKYKKNSDNRYSDILKPEFDMDFMKCSTDTIY